jgi:hypothetical protein
MTLATRDDFMSFFRNDDKLNQLSPDDRMEIFQTILQGAADITEASIQTLCDDYDLCVEVHFTQETTKPLRGATK